MYVKWCYGLCWRVEGVPRYMRDAARESHPTHPETLYPGWKFFKVLSAQQRDQGHVVNLNVKLESNEIICKVFTGPCYAQCFLLNLGIPLFSGAHGSGGISDNLLSWLTIPRNRLSSDWSLGAAISVTASTLLGSACMPSELTMVPKDATDGLKQNRPNGVLKVVSFDDWWQANSARNLNLHLAC